MKTIKDIRLYESNIPNVSGNSLPAELGKLIPSQVTFTYWTIRIARKLHEMQFSLGATDHLYINFSNCLQQDVFQVSDRKPAHWIQYVDVGMDFEKFKQKSLEEQENAVVNYIFKALQCVATADQQKILADCLTIIQKQGKKTIIHYKSKEVNSYRVRISYQIAPNDKLTLMLIDYTDKKTKEQQHFEFPVRFFEDIYALIDTVKVVNNRIEMLPKKSYKAELYNNSYHTPLLFQLK